MALEREPSILDDHFTRVWLWDEWSGCDGRDIGIGLVAKEDGGLCAIQCKLFDPHRPVPKKAIASFMSASEPDAVRSWVSMSSHREHVGP